MEYNEILEKLSEQSHIAWEHWSKTVSKQLREVLSLLENPEGSDLEQSRKILQNRLDRWEKNWVPYSELSEEVKDQDREWAEKMIDLIPFKCPIYSCGGIMKTIEVPPKEGTPDDYPDGYPGDDQIPHLQCENCNGRYKFSGFKNGNDKVQDMQRRKKT
jgi:hypothetical protein